MKTYLIYFIAAMIIVPFGEYFSKLYANTLSLTYMAISAVCFFGGTMLWFQVIRHNNQLGVMSVLWSMVTLIICVAMGVFMFKETLTTTQWFGVILALLSIYLIMK